MRHRPVADGYLMLDSLMFDHVCSFSFAVMVGCLGAKAHVRPGISDDAVMHVAVKGGVF